MVYAVVAAFTNVWKAAAGGAVNGTFLIALPTSVQLQLTAAVVKDNGGCP